MFNFLGRLIKRTIQIVAGLCILFVGIVFFYNPADTSTVSKTSTTIEKKVEETKVVEKPKPVVLTVEQKMKKHEGTLAYACTQAVKASATYPSKVDPNWGADVKSWKDWSGTNNHRFLITRKGEMMNGFGNMIPYVAVCKVDWNHVTNKSTLIEFYLNDQILIAQ